jgi:hypothetical protein
VRWYVPDFSCLAVSVQLPVLLSPRFKVITQTVVRAALMVTLPVALLGTGEEMVTVSYSAVWWP